MSKLAVASSTVSYGGTSRIPRRFGQSQSLLPSIAPTSNTMENGIAPKKMSRLEQMQANFQLQILKDKEEKMTNIYQETQQRALQRVNQNRGFARDFFEERRNSPGTQHSTQTPSLQHTYTVKKNEFQQKSFGYQGANNSKQIHNNRITNGPIAKTSAGRDRSNPLAPIKRTNSGQSNTSFPTRAKIVRPKTFTGINQRNGDEREYVPKSAPNGTPGFDRLSDGSSDDTPPPNARQLQGLQQRRKVLQNQQVNKPNQTRPKSKEGKMTDFQKWQQEQDKNREIRLQKQQNLQKQRERIGVIRTPPQDEGYEEEEDVGQSTDVNEQQNTAEIKRKQQELLAQIEHQQQELERLRRAREEEEIEEAKHQERRAKQERERKRQMEEAERERRIQEEEEEERHQREMELARARKAELERQKQKSRPPPKHQYEYEDSDPEDSPAPYKTKTPAPPSGPKPATRRAPPQQRENKYTPQPARESPPLDTGGGSHLALYEGALQDSDAYGDTGKLKACYNCGRKFAVDRLSKHEKACKNVTKKRKVMDPTKLRTAGTEMEQYVKRMPDKPKSSKKNSNWRAQHKSFMDAIKYAKKVKQIEESGGNLADLPPPPRSENPDYVQCPHCTRRFNPSTAERHIPHCKNARARPAPLKRR